MNSGKKRDQLINMINDSIYKLEKEIENSINGFDAVDDLEHLQFIKSTLLNMKLVLTTERDKKTINPTIARIVNDSWPLNHNLGNQICEIEYLYKRLYE